MATISVVFFPIPKEKSQIDLAKRTHAEKMYIDEIYRLRAKQLEEAHQRGIEAIKKNDETKSKMPAPRLLTHVQRSDDEMTLNMAPGVSMVFVKVPAGDFIMGDSNEQQTLQMDEYWIGKAPVTNLQYQVYVQSTRHDVPDHWVDGKIPSRKEDHPVVEVSFFDAYAFCKWFSDLSEKVIRLPTETEWEKAARGTDGREFPWGEKEPGYDLCNFDKYFGGTTRVGLYSPAGDSPYGCVDMAGNVWEWTSSHPHRLSFAKNMDNYIMRGGSWDCYAGAIRSANCPFEPPGNTRFDYGFRCAHSP